MTFAVNDIALHIAIADRMTDHLKARAQMIAQTVWVQRGYSAHQVMITSQQRIMAANLVHRLMQMIAAKIRMDGRAIKMRNPQRFICRQIGKARQIVRILIGKGHNRIPN